MTRLNLGSGMRHLDGFLSVDFKPYQGVGLVHDLRNPLPYEDGVIDEIFASHTIEHFRWSTTLAILADWCRVLKTGGKLDVWTVNFEDILRIYSSINDEISKMGEVNRLIYNHDVYEGSDHLAVFTSFYLKKLMLQAGFTKVESISLDEFPFPGVHAGFNMGVRGYK